MKFDYTARVRAGIVLIVLLGLHSNWRLLRDSTRFNLSSVGNDDITLYLKRFDEVRKYLPPNGTVGYLGDPINNVDGTPNGAALRNWYLAQYTLAPVVLSTLPGERLFLMNNSPQATESDGPKEGSYTIQELGSGHKVLNFGDGIRLLTSESQ